MRNDVVRYATDTEYHGAYHPGTVLSERAVDEDRLECGRGLRSEVVEDGFEWLKGVGHCGAGRENVLEVANKALEPARAGKRRQKSLQ